MKETSSSADVFSSIVFFSGKNVIKGRHGDKNEILEQGFYGLSIEISVKIRTSKVH